MAFNNVIKGISSLKLVPLAIRFASGGSKRYNHHCCAVLSAAVKRSSSVCGGNLVKRSVPLAVHRYSTKAKEESLVQVLEEEIECAEGQESIQATEIPENFPFKIEDTPGLNTITLTREYQGETIEVVVEMPNIVTGEEDDDVDEDEDEEDQDEGNESSQLPLIVTITRKSGPVLEFTCTAYPDEITIDGLSLKEPEVSEDQLPYEGPDFGDLDENLQKAFHKYLEIRGIKPSTTNFLHEYMVNKDGREYLLWLEKIKNFIQV